MNYAVLDIEAVGEPWGGRLLCVGWRDRALPPPRKGDGGEYDLAWLKMLDELASPDIAKVVFTLFDHRWLRLAGFEVRGPIYDVQAAAWVLNENTDLDLATVSRLYGGVRKEPRIRSVAGRPVFRCDDGTEVPLEDAPLDQLLAYNEGDLVSTLTTFEAIVQRLRWMGEGLDEFWAEDVLNLTPVLADMMTRGLPVDVEAARALRDELAPEVERIGDELRFEAELPENFKLVGDQLRAYLYSDVFDMRASVELSAEQRAELKAIPKEHRVDYARSSGFGLPANFDCGTIGRLYAHGTKRYAGRGLRVHKHTETGKPSVDAKTLAVHYGSDPWVAKYLGMSKKRTVVNTFLDPIDEKAHDGRLYAYFNQTGTVTGRLSSSGPNLQNQPSRGELGHAVRSLFVPPPGFVFVHGDYGQLEPRLMAHLSGDPVLCDIFNAGEDVYLRTAEEVFKERLVAEDPRRPMMKEFVLAMGYGAGAVTLRERLAIQGFPMPGAEVADILARLKKVYHVFFDWKEDVIADAQVVGYVDTLGGHRRRVELGPARSWRALEGRAGRQAANSKVQGTAAEVVGRAMVALADKLPDLHLVAQVHDELLAELERALATEALLADVEHIATTAHGFDLQVPLVFEPKYVQSWAEGKE